jgi:lipoprotein-anchoring transpeptidase ErfK/SrfK
MRPGRAAGMFLASVGVAALLGACARPEDLSLFSVSQSGYALAADPRVSTVAQTLLPSLEVFDRPGDPQPARRLANPTAMGTPLTLLAASFRDGWLEVLLPVRPNGARGWVRITDVGLTQHDLRVKVEIGERRLSVWKGRDRVLSTPVGVGRGSSPTPSGIFYTTELVRPADPHGPYGEFAFGLSGYSDTYLRYKGGDGQVGIHGTDDERSVGREVSHGCIRVPNDVMRRLARMLPLGTPVFVVR